MRTGNETVRVAVQSQRRAVIWSMPVFLTLHNAEEAIAFRRYLPRAPLLPAPLSALESRLTYASLVQALVVLSIGAFALAIAVNRKLHSARLFWCLLALQAAIGLNVLTHVVSAILLWRGYSPGLITALLLNAPFTAYCFMQTRRRQWVSATALRATVPPRSCFTDRCCSLACGSPRS